MNIKLEQYKIFNEAASTLSFSLAARNLFITQSAVSQTICTLEKELQTQLFVRQPKGVSLTTEGELLHQHIHLALSIITGAENQLANCKELIDGELTIGAGDTLSKHYVLPYIAEFHQLYPGITIKVINRTSYQTIELLKTGQIDLGFVNMPLEDDSICISECLEIQDIFISKHSDTKVYTHQELAAKPLIMLEKSANSRNYVEQVFASEGVSLHPNIELGSHDLLLEFTKNNLGIACVIEQFSTLSLTNKRVYPIQLEKPIPKRSIGYAYLKRRTLSPACLKFIELLNS